MVRQVRDIERGYRQVVSKNGQDREGMVHAMIHQIGMGVKPRYWVIGEIAAVTKGSIDVHAVSWIGIALAALPWKVLEMVWMMPRRDPR